MDKGYLYIAFCILLSCRATGQENGVPVLQPGDTLYRAWDLLPANMDIHASGESAFWDLSNLMIPYVHELYVRPVPPDRNPVGQGRIAMTDAHGIERFYSVKNGTTSITGYRLSILGMPDIAGRCDPPIVIRDPSMQVGDTGEYRGTLTFYLRSSNPELDEIRLGDSLRIRVDIERHMEMTGSGEIQTPGGIFAVDRQYAQVNAKTTVQVWRDGVWTDLVYSGRIALPGDIVNGRIYTFWSPLFPDPVAVAYTDLKDDLSTVEFKVSPTSGRVVRSRPNVPDVFVYPNPTLGPVRFDFINLEPGLYQIEIYNILGLKVRTEEVLINGSRTVPVDLSDLKKGTYIYRLVDSGKNAIRSKRLVIITP